METSHPHAFLGTFHRAHHAWGPWCQVFPAGLRHGRQTPATGFRFQIRKDALRALNVAYTVSTQRSTGFPLDGVVRMLLFRDPEEATEFLSYHGLAVSDGSVRSRL